MHVDRVAIREVPGHQARADVERRDQRDHYHSHWRRLQSSTKIANDYLPFRVITMKTKRAKARRNPRALRLHGLELLENRTLMAGDAANVFAVFDGGIDKPGAVDRIDIAILPK